MRKRIWTLAVAVMGILTVLTARPAAAADMTQQFSFWVHVGFP